MGLGGETSSHWCRSRPQAPLTALSPHHTPPGRFEWELSLEEATRRKLEACVKNSVSFMSREKEPLGKVRGGIAMVTAGLSD